MSEITRQEPPPKKAGPGSLDARIAELQANPGRWALVKSDAPSNGPQSPYRNRGCETTSRTNPSGRIDIYARWPEDPS